MNITKVLAVSLSVVSGSAMAFQANDRGPIESNQPLQRLESQAFSSYSQHASALQAPFAGTCSALPLNGCGCAFCAMLRSQRM